MTSRTIARLGIGVFLGNRQVDQPDGRPLHRYETNDEEFVALRAYVHEHIRDGYSWTARDSGALVLLLSEWSFREATRLHGFWEDAQTALDVRFDDLARYQRLAAGFRFWRRRVAGLSRRRWITSLVREGGFPVKLSTAGLDGLIDGLLRRFSWEFLASSGGDGEGPATRVAQHLLESGGRQLTILDSQETAEFLAEMVTSLARYRAELDRGNHLPRSGEEVGPWLARLPAEYRPDQYLPVRARQLDGLFRTLLFPRLDVRSDGAPLKVSIRWPAPEDEPTVAVTLPPQGVAADRIMSFFPDAARASRITFAPSETPRLGFDLERDGVSFVLRTASPRWPLWAAAGREVCILQRRFQGGPQEFAIGVTVHDPGPIAVFGPDGDLVLGRTLRAATPYRIAFADIPRDIDGGIAMRGARHGDLLGEAGEVARVTVGGETIDLVFVERPLPFEIRGPRWESAGRAGPYLGLPAVIVRESGTVFARVNKGTERRLSGGPVEFRIPAQDVEPGRVHLSLRTELATGTRTFHLLPSDTQVAWGPIDRHGGRRLTVSSSELHAIRLLDEAGRELEQAQGDGLIQLTVPACTDERLYTLELCYAGAVVEAPLADVRRCVAITLGKETLSLDPKGPVLRLERTVARLAAVTGSGHPAGRPIEISIHSVNRGMKLDRHRKLQPIHTDEDGEFRLPLDGFVDALDNSARHRIVLDAADDRARWTFEVDDTHFESEPGEGERYGTCLPGCQIGGVPTWKWVPAARQWEPPREAAMVGNAEEGWAPPAVRPVAGGMLAAPFVGQSRAAYVRYLPGPPLPDTEEPLVRALADREGLTPALLREEFGRDRTSRARLVQALANLTFFSAGDSLRMTRLARMDGAPLVYSAIRPGGRGIATAGDLRAVPLGAWLRVADALFEDTLEWVSHLYQLESVAEAPLVICALNHAGLKVPPADKPSVTVVEESAKRILARRLKRATASGETLEPTMSLFDAERKLAIVLTQWLRADREAVDVGVLDPEMAKLGIRPRALEDLLRSGFPEAVHLFDAPALLAASAAAVVLDPSLPIKVRSELRRLLVGSRQQRCWTLFEPVVSGLYQVALSSLLQEFRRKFPHPEAARAAARLMEVEEVVP